MHPKAVHLGLLLLLPALLCGAAAPAIAEETAFAAARQRMVATQMAERGITHPATLAAMATVPRHRFVPDRYRERAYADGPLPIGHGQTISQPYIVAFMTEAVRPGPGVKVLEIGTGSGYQAAVLAETGAQVYSIEIIPELAAQAAERLTALGYDEVILRQGDGFFGWPEHAPFDAIVVTAAAPTIPPPLLGQLKPGGRMIIPVGTPFLTQNLVLIEKKGERIVTRSLMPVRFVPLRRAE